MGQQAEPGVGRRRREDGKDGATQRNRTATPETSYSHNPVLVLDWGNSGMPAQNSGRPAASPFINERSFIY
jgi:hypothetical protein